MKETKEKKCPICKSENVRDTLTRVSDGAKTYLPGRAIEMPNIPVYQCNEENCKTRFVYKGN